MHHPERWTFDWFYKRHDMDKADNRFYRTAAADAVAPTLTTEQVCNIGFAVLRAHNDDRLWRALTYDSGPYDLTTPNLALQQLVAAFFAAGGDASAEKLAQLHAEVAQARQTAEYWKAEHLAGNARIGELHDEVDRLAKQRDDYRHGMTVQMEAVASMVDLLHRMLEAPTTQISVNWKDAVRQALALGPNVSR